MNDLEEIKKQKYSMNSTRTISYQIPTPFTMEPNTQMRLHLSVKDLKNILKEEWGRLNCFVITNSGGQLCVPKVLIDYGYILNNFVEDFDVLTFWLRNDKTVPISEYVTLEFYFVLRAENYDKGLFAFLNYNFALFEQTDEDKLDVNYNYIKELKLSNIGDNSIDIEFSKPYHIEGKGTLVVYLRASSVQDFEDWPLLFILRSRFSIKGVKIHSIKKSPYTYEVTLVNDSIEAVDLRNRFLSILLPPSCNDHNLLAQFIGKALVENTNIPFNYLGTVKQRKEYNVAGYQDGNEGIKLKIFMNFIS